MPAFTPKLNIKLIQETEKFIDESFNNVILDIDNKLVGVDHLSSGAHWDVWNSASIYNVNDVVRWPNLLSHQYAKCIASGTSNTNSPTSNVTGSMVNDGSVTWLICSLTDSSSSNNGISIWQGTKSYTRNDTVLHSSVLYRCKISHISSASFSSDINNWQEIFSSVRLWESSALYLLNDTVLYDDYLYKCIVQHTSGATFSTSNWQRICDLLYLTDWESNKKYDQNQLVNIDGIVYKCLIPHTSSSSSDLDTFNWVPICATICVWSPNSFYNSSVIVIHNNNLYVCNMSHVSTSSFPPITSGYWTLLNKEFSFIPDWNPSVDYYVNSVVKYDNNLYRAVNTHNDLQFSSTNWELITDNINIWNSNSLYVVGQIVLHDNKLYRCIVSNSDNIFTVSNWQKITCGSLETWASNKDYSVGDIVINANKIYQCNTSHTSSSSFNADTDNWTEISACINRIPNWIVNTEYVVGDLVAHDAKIYRCIAAHTSDSTQWNDTEEDNWEELSPTINEISTWAVSTDYAVGQLVIYDNKLYRCNTAHTSDSTSFNTDIAYWDVIGSSGIDSWKTGEVYKQGSMVVYNDKIYVCDTAHTSANPFDYTKWHEVSSTTIEDWQANTEYVENQPIEYNDTLFRANKDFTSGTTVSDDDSNMDFVYANLSMWKSGIYYRKGSIVIDSDDKIYRCKQSHTSSSANRDTNWEELSKTLVEEYAQNKNYAEGSPVLYRGKLYRANTDVQNSPAVLDPTKWDNIIGSSIDLWYPLTAYNVGNVVVINNQLYRCKTAHTSDSSDFSADINKWDVISTKMFWNTWHTESLYLANEMVNIGANWYKAKDSHVSCNTKFEDDFDDHWELIDKIDDWESGSYYSVGSIVRKDKKLYRCKNSTNSAVFDPADWEIYLRYIDDWAPNVNSPDAPLVYVDFDYDMSVTGIVEPYNHYSDAVTGTVELSEVDSEQQLGTGAKLSSSSGSHTFSTPPHAVNSSNSYTIEFILYEYSGNYLNFAEPYNDHLYLNTDKSVYLYYLAVPEHKLFARIGEYEYSWEVNHTGNTNHFIHALAFTFTSTGTNLFVDGVLALETDYISADITFNIHSELGGFAYGNILVDELLITKGVLYSSDYSPSYNPRKKPVGYSYEVGDLVVYDNNIYQCVKANTDGKFDYTKWKLLGAKGKGIIEWNTVTNYSEDDLVIYKDEFYRCNSDHVSTDNFVTDFRSDKWTKLTTLPLVDVTSNGSTVTITKPKYSYLSYPYIEVIGEIPSHDEDVDVWIDDFTYDTNLTRSERDRIVPITTNTYTFSDDSIKETGLIDLTDVSGIAEVKIN